MEHQPTIASAESARGNADDIEYDAFIERINARFQLAASEPLFTTDAVGLWEAYLDGFPAEQRQFHNCTACRRFIERVGQLVTIVDGVTHSAIWDDADAPALYRRSVDAMVAILRRASVTGVFLSSLPVWGQPETGVWHHFAVRPPSKMLFARVTQTAGQAMAEKRQDFITVHRALREFTPEVVGQALSLLKTEALYRSEKVSGPAQWLFDLHEAIKPFRGRAVENTVWRAVAAAPAGFCHPRSSMVGTLLEDLAAGMDFAEVSRRFSAKMSPLLYQRPQAAPSAGNIAEAEKIIGQLGAAGALERRFARLDELQTLWKPAKPVESSSGGVFGHLKPKGAVSANVIEVPEQAITWEKFARTVLPEATTIEVLVPRVGGYAALVTAVNADAPPILQWDTAEQRNPVSWYLYPHGSSAAQWGLTAGAWVPVTAVTMKPSQWFGGGFSHQGEGAFLILQGAKDSRSHSAGNALFPETLKAELRGIRSTLEAYSRSAVLQGADEASACGLLIAKGQPESANVRVTSSSGTRSHYKIDRWD